MASMLLSVSRYLEIVRPGGSSCLEDKYIISRVKILVQSSWSVGFFTRVPAVPYVLRQVVERCGRTGRDNGRDGRGPYVFGRSTQTTTRKLQGRYGRYRHAMYVQYPLHFSEMASVCIAEDGLWRQHSHIYGTA